MKKKMKAFFTMNRHANEGFTLVELIVVIAILAILAGVAVPAYSGYIEKAERAADDQLLGTLNTAFAAACAFNGESNYGRNDNPSITINAGAVESNALNTANNAINLSFEEFFEGGVFKTYTNLYYDAANGMFTAKVTNNMFADIFGGLDLGDYVGKVNSSTFGTIGADGLVERLDVVTGLAADLLGTEGTAALALQDSLLPGLMQAMGYNPEVEAEYDAFWAMLDEKTEGMTDEEANAYTNNLLANYAVLQVAGSTAGKDADTLLTDMKTNMNPNDIANMIKGGGESSKEGAAQAAMVYAMYTAYANGLPDGDEKTAALNNLKDMDSFVAALTATELQEDSNFMKYLDNDDGKGQAEKDMEGFIAAMNIINSSTKDNPDATLELLENGYNNQDLINAMQGLLTK